MRKLLVALVLVSSTVSAQTFRQLGWDQEASTLEEAQNATYKYYLDGNPTGTNFTTVTCTGSASPYQCVVDFPATTPGSHIITITASNVAGESGQSNEFKFSTVIILAAPKNLRGIP